MRLGKLQQVLAMMPGEHQRKFPQAMWDRMTPTQKIEGLAGHSLDNCRIILDLPIEMAIASPVVMTGKCQIIRGILACLTKVGIENARHQAMQDEVLGQLIADLDMEEAADPPRPNGR